MDEVNSMINAQKQKHKQIEEQKILLLGSAEEGDKYQEVKQAFGFTDTDNTIRAELNKTLELSKRMKAHNTERVLTKEELVKYCIRNNYVLCQLRDYKGRIPDKMLEAIDRYFKDNNFKFGADTFTNSIYILCRLSDVEANNTNLKKSKRYKKGICPKIILLHKLEAREDHHYNESHYKVIDEQGTKQSVSNFFNMLFKTHTKQKNFLNNIVLFTGIFLVYYIISVLYFGLGGESSVSNIKDTIFWFTPMWIKVSLVILICKTFVSTSGLAYENSLSFNKYNDDYEDSSQYVGNEFVSSWLFNRFGLNYYQNNILPLKRMFILRNQLSYWFLILCFSIFTFGVLHIQKMHFIQKYKNLVSITHDGSKTDNIIEADLYKATSFITYDKIKITKKYNEWLELVKQGKIK